MARSAPVADAGPHHPRVSVEDYLANLERFRAEAQNRGIPIAVLTRPHKLPPEVLSQDTTWRGSVPKYNAALVDWAQHRNVPVIDVQRFFQQLPNALFSDECHLTIQGYQQMAELVRDQLVSNPDRSPPLVWADRPNPKVPSSSHDRDQRVSLLDSRPSSAKRPCVILGGRVTAVTDGGRAPSERGWRLARTEARPPGIVQGHLAPFES